MSSLEQLLLKARKIKAETTDRANTALRIGGWMEEVLLYLDEVLEGKLPTQSSELITKSKELVSAINEIASMSNLSSEKYNAVISKLAMLNSLHPIARSGSYNDLENRPYYENRVVMTLPIHNGDEIFPIMSWNAYEDTSIGLRYATENKYHFLIAVSSNNDGGDFGMMLQVSGTSSNSTIKQYFYNGSYGTTVPLRMYLYHPTGSYSYSSRIIIGFRPEMPSSTERPIAFIPISLDMPGFKWEDPTHVIDTADSRYILQSGKFVLSFPDAMLYSRINGGSSNGVEQLLYAPSGGNKYLNLFTNDTMEIVGSDDSDRSTVDWRFSVKKVPNQLFINEKIYDGSEELKIEVADTPLTTQEILSILT